MSRIALIIALAAALCATAAFGQSTKIRLGTQTQGALPAGQGGVLNGGTTGQVLSKASSSDYDQAWIDVGDVVGPASATDFHYALFDGTSGKLLQDSALSADAVGTLNLVHTASANAVSSIALHMESNYGGGTPINGFGEHLGFFLETSTTNGREAGRISVAWSDITDASRTAFMDFLLVNNAAAAASKMRLFPSGGLAVNNTTDPGAGIISANTGFRIGTSASTSGVMMQSDGSKFTASSATWPSTGTNGQAVIFDGNDFVTSSNAAESDALNAYQALGSSIKAQTVGVGLDRISSSFTMVDSQAQYVAIWLPVRQTLTGVKWYQQTVGNYTGDNNNKIALYSYSGGTLTRVAQSTNDAALWSQAGGNVVKQKGFSATYDAAPGLYFVALLYNNSAQITAPIIGAAASVGNAGIPAGDFTNSAKLWGNVGSQTDLPSTQASSGLTTATAQNIWVAVY